MTKMNFLLSLSERLSSLPRQDMEERLSFYSEMIEDRMEEGLSEEDAVAAVGSVNEISEQILSEFSSVAAPPVKDTKRKMKAWEIVLLVLGSPVWVSLLIAAIAIVFALYVCLWAVVVCLWAAFAAVAGSSVGAMAFGIANMFQGNMPAGVSMIAAGIVCSGFSILLFFGCKGFTKFAAFLTAKPFRSGTGRFKKGG